MYYLCKVCFVCLRDKNLYNVLDKNKESFETITFVLPELTISEAEIPVHICSACNKNLQKIYKLKKICLEKFYQRFGSKSQVNCDKNGVVIKQKNKLINSCFICSKNKKLRNLFDEDENDSFSEIAFGLPEIVVADTNVSPKVCLKCTSKLLYLYKLKKKYLECYCKWVQFPDKLGDDDNQKLSNLNIKLDKIQEVIKTENIEMGQFEIVIKTETNNMDMEDPISSMKQNEFNNIVYNIQDDFKFDNLQTVAKTENVRINEEILELEDPLVKPEQDESENKDVRRSDFMSSTTSRKIYSRDHENVEEYYDEEYVSESEEDIFADNSDDDRDFRPDSDSGSNISENDVQNTVNNIWDDDFTEKKLLESKNYVQEYSDEEDFRGFEKVTTIRNKCCESEIYQENKSMLTNKKTKQNHFKTDENLTGKKNKQKVPEISESKENSQHINKIPGKHSAKKRRFSCSMCGQMFMTKFNMQIHLERIHLGIKKDVRYFKCLLCNKELAKESLKVHYFSHLNMKFHQCTICGVKFVTNNILAVHLKTHTDKKVPKCSICGKIFQHIRDLKIHKKIVHFGRTVHQCSICNKYFNKIYDLKEHLNLHVGTNISCDICNKSFFAYRYLIRHKLEMHNIKQ